MAEPRPQRGEIWEIEDGRSILVIQQDRLNLELPTIIGLLTTDVAQSAPEPIRVALTPDETGLAHPLWVKVSLVLTVGRNSLRHPLTAVAGHRMAAVDAALRRVLELDQRRAGIA